MKTMKTWQINSTSPSKTEALGEKIGKKLKGGEIIELASDLGGGKTTFVRGLARGLSSDAHVTSPTFKINNVYRGPKLELQHFDFYRLNDAGNIADELAETIGDPHGVVVIEWGGVVQQVLPKHRLIIHFTTTAEETRQLVFTYPSPLEYLVEKLKK